MRGLRWPRGLGLAIQGTLRGSKRVSYLSCRYRGPPIICAFNPHQRWWDSGITGEGILVSPGGVRIGARSRAPSLWAEPLRSSGRLPPWLFHTYFPKFRGRHKNRGLKRACILKMNPLWTDARRVSKGKHTGMLTVESRRCVRSVCSVYHSFFFFF